MWPCLSFQHLDLSKFLPISRFEQTESLSSRVISRNAHFIKLTLFTKSKKSRCEQLEKIDEFSCAAPVSDFVGEDPSCVSRHEEVFPAIGVAFKVVVVMFGTQGVTCCESSSNGLQHLKSGKTGLKHDLTQFMNEHVENDFFLEVSIVGVNLSIYHTGVPAD